MIARHWSAVAKKEQADDYIHHLKTETFPSLKTIPGFHKASILKREHSLGIEFIVITEWASIEAIKKFAGDKADIAVVPDPVKKMMVSFDPYVRHFEIEVSSS